MVSTTRYRLILSRIYDYLSSYRDVRWAPRVQTWLTELDRARTDADLRQHAERSRKATYGMGSLGDFSISPQSGHDIHNDRHQMSIASQGLWALTHELYIEATLLLGELATVTK